MPRVDEQLLGRAKQMRTEMTAPEARPWYQLRAGRSGGVKFVRQSVRPPFIADFIARSRKLIIEIDGDTHGSGEAYDQTRTSKLEREGHRVLRFTNAEVMGNMEGVLQVITEAVRTAPLPRAFGALPLPGGERE